VWPVRNARPYRDKHEAAYDRASQRGRPRDVVDQTANMSWKALDLATDSDIGSPTTKFALHLLANKADEDSSCYPSIRTLMAESDAGRSTVMRALKELEEAGFITRRPQFHDSGAQRSTRYYLKHPCVVPGHRKPTSPTGGSPTAPTSKSSTSSTTTPATRSQSPPTAASPALSSSLNSAKPLNNMVFRIQH
jgi:Helix-turn-helix domain